MVRSLAFYLPQYHPIPQNDAWWGAGFTDWVNVAKARPRFAGHYQPHIPADLGFYDLRLAETRAAQADLAKRYGIDGFVYYHYWFNGDLLLERPAEEMLALGEPDMPFCFDWANENWTRSWDGEERQVLAKQEYDTYDAHAHMLWLSRYFLDARYIRVDGRPLWIVHVPARLEGVSDIIGQWQEHARALIGSELYICGVLGPSRLAPATLETMGFDAAIEFYPKFMQGARHQREWLQVPQRAWNKLADKLDPEARRLGRMATISHLDYGQQIADSKALVEAGGFPVHPAVFPSWDNSARRKYRANIYHNDDADLYGDWLDAAHKRALKHPADEQLVFINAWNEWAEGCHLEPDMKNGHKFLAKTLEIKQRNA